MKAIQSTKQFSMRYSPKAVTPPIAARYLLAQSNPIRLKIQHLCNNRDPNTLWWRVSSQNLQNFKRVVRSWCSRRARLAFQLELKSRGFDPEGRRLQLGDSPSPQAEDGILGNLRGSVNIIISPACVESKYSEVQAEMKTLMDALLQQQQKQQQLQPPRGKHKAAQ